MISFSKHFRQIKPYDDYNVTDVPWHEAMAAGNGRLGGLESCAPVEDSIIYQNVEFVMPSEEPRHVPYEVTSQLEEACSVPVSSEGSPVVPYCTSFSPIF